MTQQPGVVVVGDLVTDVVAHLAEPLAIGSDAGAAVRTTGGGSGANVAAWLAAAGVPVTFAGRVGDDDTGRARVDELVALGVDVQVGVDAEATTGTVVVLVTPDGERTMLPDRGANAGLTAADLEGALSTAGRHLHLSGYTLLTPTSRRAGLHALQHARQAGMTTSVDPSSTAPLRTVGAAAFLEWTAGADLCLPNLAEATVLTGTDDADIAVRRLAQHYPQVVVTLGPRGALWSNGDRLLHSPAATSTVVDTTGAGDAFTAGFLAAWLAGGSPEEALRSACALAGVATGRTGGRPPSPMGAADAQSGA